MKRALPAALIAVVLGLVASPAQAAERAEGNWQSIVNCLPTSYDPVSHDLDCVGSTLWTGTWTGVTYYHLIGNVDALTGTGSGTLHETFIGRSDDGGRGTLDFVEHLTLDGPTQALKINARLLDGTGDFVGAQGRVSFVGKSNAVTGNGTYSGTWERPSP